MTRAELLEKWSGGWEVLLHALANLTDEQLPQSVMIRGQSLAVHEALHRSLAHAGYHVGQIVYLARSFKGNDWKYLSIPPGASDLYNKDARLDRPESQTSALSDRTR